jgi:hypothetical protein
VIAWRVSIRVLCFLTYYSFVCLVLKKENKLPDDIDDILRLSGDEGMMMFILNSFVSCVVGKMEWKRRSGKELVSKLASPTDEAFALLVLENIWESWKDVDPEEYIMARARKQEDDKGNKTRRKEIAGKYTEKHRSSRRCRGWSEEGHERYNELVGIVRADRAKRGAFERYFMEKCLSGKEGIWKEDNGSNNEQHKVIALEDDWGSLYPDL